MSHVTNDTMQGTFSTAWNELLRAWEQATMEINSSLFENSPPLLSFHPISNWSFEVLWGADRIAGRGDSAHNNLTLCVMTHGDAGTEFHFHTDRRGMLVGAGEQKASPASVVEDLLGAFFYRRLADHRPPQLIPARPSRSREVSSEVALPLNFACTSGFESSEPPYHEDPEFQTPMTLQ